MDTGNLIGVPDIVRDTTSGLVGENVVEIEFFRRQKLERSIFYEKGIQGGSG